MGEPAVSGAPIATADPARADRIKYTWEWAESLEDLTRYSIEQGLFSQEKTRGDLPTLLQYICQARTELKAGGVPRARELLGQGEGLLADVRVRADGVWKSAKRRPLMLMVYHVLVVVVVLNVATKWWVFGRLATAFWGIPVTVLGFGALGASLRTLYWLYRKAQSQTFRPQFTLPYLAAPFIGGLFALLVYLVVTAGLIALAAGSGGSANTEDNTVLLALSALAGFSWEWAMSRVKEYIEKPSPSGAASGSAASAPPNDPKLGTRTDPPAPPARPSTASDRAKAALAQQGAAPAAAPGARKAGSTAANNIPAPPERPGGPGA